MLFTNKEIQNYQTKSWDVEHSAVFRRTSDPLGDFSNFAKQMPIQIHGCRVASSEHLYQAMRFPHLPEIQFQIVDADSPKAAKSIARDFDDSTREDWDSIRVNVMRWVLAKKVLCNTKRMKKAFELSDGKPIVEFSKRDNFWGAQPDSMSNEVLVGQNVLGCLLTELRQEFSTDLRLKQSGATQFDRALFLSKPI